MVERAQVLVVDASVAIKWYVEEEYREQALILRRDYYDGKVALVSQPLLFYEVANALRCHEALTSSDVVDSVNSLIDMQIDLLAPMKEVVDAAVDLAFEEGATVCDAVYLALAELTGSKVITADEKLLEKFSQGRRKNVLLIKDYKGVEVG